LCLYFIAHAGKSKEDAVEVAPDTDVGIADGAEDTATFELVEGDACPAEKEKNEDDIAQTRYIILVCHTFSHRYHKGGSHTHRCSGPRAGR
jgi:hypothetical protein